jgi:hypothetical protein
MAKDFLTGAGCVVRVKGKGSAGAYKIDGWKTGQVGTGLITIDDIQPVEQDIATPIVAVDDHRALYKFGKNFGTIQVHGTIYMGSIEKSENIIQKVTKAFDKLRLSSKSKPVNVSIAKGYKCKAYFTQMTFGQADANYNKIAYMLSGLIAPQN